MKRLYTRTEFLLLAVNLAVKLIVLFFIIGIGYIILQSPLTSVYIFGAIVLFGLAIWMLKPLGNTISKFGISLNIDVPIYIKASLLTIGYLLYVSSWIFSGAMLYRFFEEGKITEMVGFLEFIFFSAIQEKYTHYEAELEQKHQKKTSNKI